MSTIQRADALTQPEIEAIVRVVLQRLRSGESASNSGMSGTIRLAHSLVTLEDLRDRWTGLRKLQVPRRCVVTPAVIDELRQRGVVLERLAVTEATTSTSSSSSSAGPSGNASKLLVVVPRASHGSIGEQIAGCGAKVQWLEQDTSTAGLAALRQQLTLGGQFCVWCSTRPFAALLACSDDAQLAAVQLPQLDDLSRAIEQANPNVLVVDAIRWNSNALIQLVRQWLRRLP